ncbi:MAG: effector-associated domain EAD1-containing protein [Pseudomonadota bacterium]
MSVSFAELKPVYDTLLDAYPDRDALEILLAFGGPDRRIDDYVAPNATRNSAYLKIVTSAASQGWLLTLIDAVLADQALTDAKRDAIRTDWADLLRRLQPEPGFAHWEHLRTDGVAFVNRTTLRQTVDKMRGPDGARVLVLRGKELSGTSYAWRFISHLSRSIPGAKCVFIDFDTYKGDPRPLGVMEALAAYLALDASPRRADMPGDDHLATYLVNWLMGQLQQLGETRWIVFDNAHLGVLPRASKEMLVEMADALSRGTVDNARMFVLGFDMALIAASGPRALDLRLSPLGRPDFEDYLASVVDRFGGLGGVFATPAEAIDEVLDGVSLDVPTRAVLKGISDQLDRIVLAAQGRGGAPPAQQ